MPLPYGRPAKPYIPFPHEPNYVAREERSSRYRNTTVAPLRRRTGIHGPMRVVYVQHTGMHNAAVPTTPCRVAGDLYGCRTGPDRTTGAANTLTNLALATHAVA